jgi:hypothetical protein
MIVYSLAPIINSVLIILNMESHLDYYDIINVELEYQLINKLCQKDFPSGQYF